MNYDRHLLCRACHGIVRVPADADAQRTAQDHILDAHRDAITDARRFEFVNLDSPKALPRWEQAWLP